MKPRDDCWNTDHGMSSSGPRFLDCIPPLVIKSY
jgi:hypothetical protein